MGWFGERGLYHSPQLPHNIRKYLGFSHSATQCGLCLNVLSIQRAMHVVSCGFIILDENATDSD